MFVGCLSVDWIARPYHNPAVPFPAKLAARMAAFGGAAKKEKDPKKPGKKKTRSFKGAVRAVTAARRLDGNLKKLVKGGASCVPCCGCATIRR